MYRNYKGAFRPSGQAIWASARPFCGHVCAFTRPLFSARPGRFTFRNSDGYELTVEEHDIPGVGEPEYRAEWNRWLTHYAGDAEFLSNLHQLNWKWLKRRGVANVWVLLLLAKRAKQNLWK